MKKRTFLKMTSAAITGAVISSCKQLETPGVAAPQAAKAGRIKNWAGNFEFSTDKIAFPENVKQVQALVKQTEKLRPLGTQHCFNRIADSPYQLLSTKKLNRIVGISEDKKTVTVEAGVRYGTLGTYLHEKGFALQNLASLPHISVAGTIATATHGSGVKNGNLATSVTALELVNAKGEVITLTKEKNGEEFLGSVVAFGALGVVTKVTLAIQPTFQMIQHVYQNLPFRELEKNFDKIMSDGYSVSLFTNWKGNKVSEIWVKNRVIEGRPFKAAPELFDAKLATRHLHPVIDQSAESCTEQLGLPGPWHERLPHFKMNFTPSTGAELQSEFFIPRANAFAALQAINALGEKWGPDLFISEIRTIEADNLWMSTAYKRDSVAIHFTWKPNSEAVMKHIPVVEELLSPYGPRPHWGKLFTITPAQLKARYEKYADFQQLMRKYDPQGKFKNEFLELNLSAD